MPIHQAAAPTQIHDLDQRKRVLPASRPFQAVPAHGIAAPRSAAGTSTSLVTSPSTFLATSPSTSPVAHRFGRFAIGSLPATESRAPVQLKRSVAEWLKHKMGIGHDWQSEHRARAEVGERSGLIEHGHHRGVGIDFQEEIQHDDYPEHGAASQKAILDARTMATGAASAGKIGVATASAFKGATGILGPALATVAGPVGVGGSLADAGLKAKQIAKGRDKIKDKALLGLGAASDLSSATASAASTTFGASGLLSASGLMSSSASSALSAGSVAVAGPAALAMGGVDVVAGGIGAGLAEHRRGKLAAMEERERNFGSDESAILKMAKESQKTKRNRGFGTMLKGGLGLAAGGTLLAGALGATAATPVGWGLLAGAGLVGLGVLGYKQWRKHREGTRIMNDRDERVRLARLGVAMPTKSDLAAESRWRRWNPFNTKESRAHDLIRSSVARKLETNLHDPHRHPSQLNDEENSPLTAMISHLGLKNTGDKKARKKDIARALEG